MDRVPNEMRSRSKSRRSILRSFIACGLIVVAGLFVIPKSMRAASAETYYYFVFSNPVAGHEAEYNKWYNEQHALDVVAVPGFITAQRFVKNDMPLYHMVDVQLPKYLILYKIFTDDLNAVFVEV